MVFVDLDRELNLKHIKKILEISNVIVWNMEQKLETIEEVLKFQEQHKVLCKENILYLLNKYERNSKYNIKI